MERHTLGVVERLALARGVSRDEKASYLQNAVESLVFLGRPVPKAIRLFPNEVPASPMENS